MSAFYALLYRDMKLAFRNNAHWNLLAVILFFAAAYWFTLSRS